MSSKEILRLPSDASKEGIKSDSKNFVHVTFLVPHVSLQSVTIVTSFSEGVYETKLKRTFNALKGYFTQCIL